jgi:hypothetical protein
MELLSQVFRRLGNEDFFCIGGNQFEDEKMGLSFLICVGEPGLCHVSVDGANTSTLLVIACNDTGHWV